MNQIDGFEFTRYETNIIQKWDEERCDEELGVSAIQTVCDKAGNKNSKEKPVANRIPNRMRKSGVVYFPNEITRTQNSGQICNNTIGAR